MAAATMLPPAFASLPPMIAGAVLRPLSTFPAADPLPFPVEPAHDPDAPTMAPPKVEPTAPAADDGASLRWLVQPLAWQLFNTDPTIASADPNGRAMLWAEDYLDLRTECLARASAMILVEERFGVCPEVR